MTTELEQIVDGCKRKNPIAQKKLYELLGGLGKPKSFERFIIQAESCLEHNAFEKLEEIHCPTLIIGGTDDRIVTGEASQEIAERIPDSKLIMYEGLGHGLYEEAKDFLQQILDFEIKG